MKLVRPFILFAVAATTLTTTATAQTNIVDSSTYPGLLGPNGSNRTVVPVLSGLNIIAVGGTASGSLGTYWTAQADGGLAIIALSNTGAQVALTGDSLQFNLSANPGALLSSLDTGLAVNLAWSATGTFNSATAPVTLKPNSTYRVTFDLDTGAGLLNSALSISPTFGVSLLDSQNTAIGSVTGGAAVNLLGLTLSPVLGTPGTGRAVLNFKTGNSVPSGGVKLKFTGSASLPAKLVGIGSSFAKVTNLSIAYVSPYTLFVEGSGLTTPATQDPAADPDHDGRSNLGEFAFGTNPGKSDSQPVYIAVGDPDASGPQTSAGVMTFPARDGATFGTSGSYQVASADGVTYQVEGSYDLVNWTQAVSEVTANSSFTSKLPALQTGWSYHSFRVAGQTSDTPRAFLRVRYH